MRKGITVRFEVEVFDEIEAIAKRDGRSVSAQIAWLAKRGLHDFKAHVSAFEKAKAEAAA